MGLEKVGPGIVAQDQQMEAQPNICSAIGKAQIKPLVLRKCHFPEVDFEKTMDALTKALMEVEESGRERLPVQCRMARLPILEDFVLDLSPALRVCKTALAIEETLESMEKRISVMEEAVSAFLPASSRLLSPAAPAQDQPLS